MWWLALSILLLCVIESRNLMNPSKISYFNVFALRTSSLLSQDGRLLIEHKSLKSSRRMEPSVCLLESRGFVHIPSSSAIY